MPQTPPRFIDFMVYLPPTPCVVGIYGSLGGGKTLSAVDIALHFINHFNLVCSNIQLKNLSDRQKAYYSHFEDVSKVDWFSLPVGSPRGSGGSKRVAVIIDELPELLDQYSNGKDYWIKVLLSWLRHTSKRGQYVFIITQDPSFILKPVRLLCAYWIKCEDMGEYRIPIIRLKIPFFKDLISRRTYNRDGTCINGSLNTARKSVIGRFYNTAQGLSLYNSSSSFEFYDPFSRFMFMYSKWDKYIKFSSILFIVFVSLFLVFCFRL